MMEATSISISYSEVADRIFVDAGDGRATGRLILTRRITKHLVSAFVTLLERSSAALKKVPADMRTEVIALEHLSAMNQAEEAKAPARAAQALPTAFEPVVIVKVDVRVLVRTFRLEFNSAREPVATFTVNRMKFHKFLATLDRLAAAAEWNIRDGAGWLDTTVANAGGGRRAS